MIVSSKSQINTRSVVSSGALGETVFVRRPRPLGPRASEPKAFAGSRERRDVSPFKGDIGLSPSVTPFDGLSSSSLLLVSLYGHSIYN